MSVLIVSATVVATLTAVDIGVNFVRVKKLQRVIKRTEEYTKRMCDQTSKTTWYKSNYERLQARVKGFEAELAKKDDQKPTAEQQAEEVIKKASRRKSTK